MALGAGRVPGSLVGYSSYIPVAGDGATTKTVADPLFTTSQTDRMARAAPSVNLAGVSVGSGARESVKDGRRATVDSDLIFGSEKETTAPLVTISEMIVILAATVVAGGSQGAAVVAGQSVMWRGELPLTTAEFEAFRRKKLAIQQQYGGSRFSGGQQPVRCGTTVATEAPRRPEMVSGGSRQFRV